MYLSTGGLRLGAQKGGTHEDMGAYWDHWETVGRTERFSHNSSVGTQAGAPTYLGYLELNR